MNTLISFVLMVAASLATPVTPTNWYVRVDGGTRFDADVPAGQCDGKADAPYPGTGVNQHCAFKGVAYLFFDGVYTVVPKPIIKGGDIVHVGPGQFRVGYLGNSAADHDGMTIAGDPFASAMIVPGGTADHPTTFIGAGEDKTQIFSGYGSGPIFDLKSASYVTIQDMELTDHAQCTRVGAPQTPGCQDGGVLADYGQVGIQTSATSHDIALTNLNIHGFTTDGIRGGIGGLVTVRNVRIGFNGSAGWDFDDGSNTPNGANAQVIASKLLIEGSGCNEEYPIVHPGFPAYSCYDQNSAGYGDGVGTPDTTLNFTCDQCTFRYNTQDGLDLLHTHGSTIKVTNSNSYGNMGQQWKLGPMKSVLFQNNTWVHNCLRMDAPIAGNSTFNKYLSNYCRAAGDGLAMAVTDGGTYVLQNNSYAGYGSTTYDLACVGTCTESNIVFENNLHIGYLPAVADAQLPGVFYWDTTQGMPANPFKAVDHNIFFNMRTLPDGGVGTDPHIANEPVWKDETSLDAVDFHLTAASVNALGQGVDGADIGAYGLAPAGGGTTPPPDGGGSTTTPPPSGGSTTPPPTMSPFTISLPTLTCTPSGTKYVCTTP